MTKFSQRMGLTPLEKVQQIDSLDQETRNQIWSLLKTCVLDSWSGYPGSHDAKELKIFYQRLWIYFFKLPLDSISGFSPYDPGSPYLLMRKTVMEGDWYLVLDLVEHTIKNRPDDEMRLLTKVMNGTFERENVGYRVIDSQITPITSPIEIDSITQALKSPYKSITSHLQTALDHLSSKMNPDYRNSIKESISAVEAVCKLIAQDNQATLGAALAKIIKSHSIPKSLRSALGSMYGYTSNEGGIRHALTEDEAPLPTFADAKFMLVSCTAFVNYLLTIAAEENISLEIELGQ